MKDLLKKLQDRDIELFMSVLLITGVIISAVVVLIGGIIYLYENKYVTSNYNVFIGEPERLRNFYEITRGAFHFQGRALIQFGVLLLIATPVARVLFAIVGFFLERDKLYTMISLVVFVILLTSLIGALG